MSYKRTQINRGYDIYEVENYAGMTMEEIAKKCDCNNWGYCVLYKSADKLTIKIYTD
jgi:hypothetical protein